MARKVIDLTTPQPNGKMGEPTKAAWEKTNDNFEELYNNVSDLSTGNTQTSSRLDSIGWGINPLSFASNINAVNRSLVQAFANPSGTLPPSQQYGTVTVLSYGANEYTQLAQSVTSNEMAFRHFNSQFGGWQQWNRVWSTGNTTVDSNNFIKRA